MSKGKEYQRVDRKSSLQDDWYLQRRREMSGEKKTVLAKLEISQPEDLHEKEADAIANKIVNGGDANVSQLTPLNNSVQLKTENVSMTESVDLQSKLQSSKGSGQPMDDAVKNEMESKMGADLSDVKIHTGAGAHDMSESINAKAFTHGQDIYFKDGNYNPGSKEGKELLAHELAHTQQQGSVEIQPKIQKKDGDDRIPYQVYVTEAATQLTDPVEINLYIFTHAFQTSDDEVRKRMPDLNWGWENSVTGEKTKALTNANQFQTFYISPARAKLFADMGPNASKDKTGRLTGHEEGDQLLTGFSGDYIQKINAETNERYFKITGNRKVISKSDPDYEAEKLQWLVERDKLMKQYEQINALPTKVHDIIFAGVTGAEPQPKDFDKILALAKTLEGLTDDDLDILKKTSGEPSADIDLVTSNVQFFVDCLPWVLRMHDAIYGKHFKWNLDLSLKAPLIDPAIDMTDEDAIFRTLNLPAEKVALINSIYNEKYFPNGGGSMTNDIDSDMDGRDWELAKMLLGRAGIMVQGEVVPPSVDQPSVNGSVGIFCSDPNIVITPQKNVWFSMEGNFKTYDWGILYESGNVLIATDKSASYVPARPDQIDGLNMFKMNWTDWKFPGNHTVLCRVTDDSDKITYYSFKQEVRGDERDISALEVQYELIAHDFAYRNYLKADKKVSSTLTGDDKTKADADFKGSILSRALLEKWGYSDKVVEEDHENEPNNGFFAVLILPQKDRTDLNPIIAFRGTSNTPDFITDSDTKGPGWTQYNLNIANIQKLITKSNNDFPGKKIDLTGHSLGGALAQWTATDDLFKGKFNRVITFQSPGISAERVNNYNKWDKNLQASTVIHHITTGDIVPYAGEASMPGTFYEHTTQSHSALFSHTHLLLESEAYEAQRKTLGITDDVLTNLGWNEGNLPTERDMPVKTSGFPHNADRQAVELLRKAVRKKIDDIIAEQAAEKAKQQAADMEKIKKLIEYQQYLEMYYKLLGATYMF